MNTQSIQQFVDAEELKFYRSNNTDEAQHYYLYSDGNRRCYNALEYQPRVDHKHFKWIIRSVYHKLVFEFDYDEIREWVQS